LEYKSTELCSKHAAQRHYRKGIEFIRKEFNTRKIRLQIKASYDYKAYVEFKKGIQIASITNQKLDAKILLQLATYEMIQNNNKMVGVYCNAVITNSNATSIEIQDAKQILQTLN
tara:strand:+ start:1836 stop:2180 length:345 start_codon:yes stop_codon:yes gene_type:complete